MTRAEQKAYQAWLDLRKRISTQTEPVQDETPRAKARRIKRLTGNFQAFCKYYFPHYVQSDFAWFHKKAARDIKDDPNILAILEWAREHAKSVFADVFIPMFLKARGELDGMILGSATQDKAKDLISDIQAELMDNRRYIEDFGNQKCLGSWQDGHFKTADGIGFWGFGRGQSPRGTREAERRPNYGVIDDIDDDEIVKNQQRVLQAVDWVLGSFFGALSIKGARLVIAGNRIHKQSILAHLVGDIDPDDPKRERITHIKVFAIEDSKHRKASAANGQPAWKERYTLDELVDKMLKMGWRNARREFFHEHIEEGHVFKREHILWAKLPPLKKYKALVVYVDPSFKGTKKNDYKAIVLIGRIGKYYDVIKAWLRQDSIAAMVRAHYDLHEDFGEKANIKHYMEANFIQDQFLDDYEAEGVERGYQLPIRPDKRKKPDKFGRVENLSPLFERHFVRFNQAEKKNPDMRTLVDQFLAFPYGPDDGPDATEGGIFKLNRATRSSNFRPRTGSHRRPRSRQG